jgi:hypothetical protein
MTDYNNEYNYPKPSLTEPGVTFFLHQTLKQCHITKDKFNNLMFNITLLILFMLILGFILFYKYKGKLTPQELENKKKEKQQYILSKIKNFQQAKRLAQQELITGLPQWENDHDMIQSTSSY